MTSISKLNALLKTLRSYGAVSIAISVILLLPSVLTANDFENNLNNALKLYKEGKYVETFNEISNAMMLLHNQKKFQLVKYELCTEILGYGEYVKREDNKLKPSEPLLFYLEVDGYGVQKTGDNYGFWISEDVKIIDAEGKIVLERTDFLNYKKVFPVPVIPLYLQNKIGNLPPGKYKYEFTIKDQLKKTFLSAWFEFEVMKEGEVKEGLKQ